MAWRSGADGTGALRRGGPTPAPGANPAPAPGDYDVLTPERVSLQYDLAGIGTRSAAALIDFSIQGTVWAVLTIGLFVGAGVLSPSLVRGQDHDSLNLLAYALAGWLVMTFLVLWGYGLLFEIFWSGQTPGKRLLGLRAIRENGYPLRAGDAVVRNLLRILDGPPVMYWLGLLVMLLNDRSKRLGDFAAGTVVVREGPRTSLMAAPAAPAASPAPGPPATQAAIGGDDATLVRDYLLRRASMAAKPRAALAARLAAALASRYGLDRHREALADDERFLQEIVGGR